jgi:hypothetical protein
MNRVVADSLALAGAVALSASDINILFVHTSADVFAAWGQWAGALAGTAAVVVALWVSLGDRRKRDAERRDAEKHLARQLFLKLSLAGSGKLLMAMVVNRSADSHFERIFIDFVGARVLATNQWSKWWEPPGGSSILNPGQYNKDVLEPGASWSSGLIPLAWPGNPEELPDLLECELYARIRFADARGRLWTRTTDDPEPERVLLARRFRKSVRKVPRPSW